MNKGKKYKWIWVGLIALIAVAFTLTGCSSSDDEDIPASGESVTEETQPAPPTIEEQLQAMAEKLTLEEKVGQIFFSRCPEENAAEKAAQYHLGGYILFARDFNGKDKEAVQETIASYQDAAMEDTGVPMLIGVDEEGGIVNRVSYFEAFRAVPFWSPQELYVEGGFDLIESDTEEKCDLLTSLGINVNFAPVCDVSTDPEEYMYPRAFGRSAEETAEYIKCVVSMMNTKNMGSVLKHFPGYGNNQDTHTGISYDNRSLNNFWEKDFLPFEAGIAAGAQCVLVSHNIIGSMDENCPASLSENVHEILRSQLGFDGVMITDDLSMDAIGEYTDGQDAAVKAVLAGNDMLCCTDFETQIPAVIDTVESGVIDEDVIDQAVLRVLKWKYELGLIDLG